MSVPREEPTQPRDDAADVQLKWRKATQNEYFCEDMDVKNQLHEQSQSFIDAVESDFYHNLTSPTSNILEEEYMYVNIVGMLKLLDIALFVFSFAISA